MRRILALIMSICLMVALVGCGKTSTKTGSTEKANEPTKAGATAAQEQKGEPENIVVRMVCLGTVPSDLKLVEDAINKISIPKINVKVSLEAISIANYNSQLTIDMTSGEQVDVFFAMNYSSLLANSQLLDITDYIKQYGQGIVDECSTEWLKATSAGGRIYAVPVINGKAMTCTIAMRTDILKKYGLKTDFKMNEDIKDDGMQITLDQLDSILKTVKEKEPDLIPLYYPFSGQALTGLINYDPLTDGNGVLMGNDGWKVVDLYETDEYYQILKKERDWYQKGYIKSDAATDTESESSYMSAGRLFSTISYSEIGLDAQYKASTGYDYTCVKIKTPLISSSSLSGMIWGVSSTTKVPDASVKFLNLAYSDKDIANLMCYGVQNTHWVLNSEGTVSYPDGVDNSNAKYPSSTYWAMPNSLIADVLSGNPIDYNKTLANNNKTAPVSRALGFAFDQSKVSTQSAAVSAVLDEYLPGLKTGSLDLDDSFDKFIKKLKSAGMDDIIAEKQKQLDAWCADNGITK